MPRSFSPIRRPPFFYGWYIVAVGFLSHVVCAFHLSSTLSVFMKPLTEELGVSRGLFSMLRSGEILIGAAMAPFVGPLVDRYGGRWLVVGGALVAGAGFLLLGQVTQFWQFLLIRWTLVTVGGVFMCYMVVTVTISRWFVRKRGRAIAIASLGQGFSKVGIPLLAASLFALFGWRQTWVAFGLLTLALVVVPAFVFLQRSPEDMGFYPDGAAEPYGLPSGSAPKTQPGAQSFSSADVERSWSRGEVLRTRAFWTISFAYGMASVGIAGLNLHVFAYVTDLGHTAIIAATVLSVIAFTQLGSTLVWGVLSERTDIRKITMVQLLTQAIGLSIAIVSDHLIFLYAGFFLYGIGLGGINVLQEVVWGTYYGRLSLGAVRGLGLLVTHMFGAAGAPFFGFLFDATGSYIVSFVLFILALLVSASLMLTVRPPLKQRAGDG